jgi:glycosyltransferase involved in cell wall biosynthesis
VLEALAMGLPVVGTTSATQGVEGQPGRDFLLANSAAEQADAICGLFADPAELSAQGARGRDFVERNYDWDKVLEPLDALLDRLVPHSS